MDYHNYYIGEYCIIRTYAAGVHVGNLADYDPVTRHAQLHTARRIWSWGGAFTLSAVAQRGPTSGKISLPVDSIIVAQVEEIIPCSVEATRVLQEFPEHKP